MQELESYNPDTTVRIVVEPINDLESETRQFRRVYVCLGALKNDFKVGQRELLGLMGSVSCLVHFQDKY